MAEQVLPTLLGQAKIDWEYQTPHKVGNEIRVAKSFKGLTVVAKGSACVVEYEPPKRERGGSSLPSDRRTRNYFFGTDIGPDGKPFLTAVSKRAVNALHLGGEEAFFKALVPPVIAKLSLNANQPLIRQGDFYAVKIAECWEYAYIFFADMQAVKLGTKRRGLRYCKVEERRLFQARHVFTGELLSAVWLAKGRTKHCPSEQHFCLVCGEISAPDHPSLHLDEGVYAIAKSAAVFSPERLTGAD